MINKVRILILIAFWGLSSYETCHGQSNERISDDQFNAWYMYFGSYRLTDNIGIHAEVQFRRSGAIADPQQLLTRFGINYHLSKVTMLTGGYGYIVSHPYGEQPIPDQFFEHRVWQQLILNHSDGGVYFNHRYRQEQRWLEQADNFQYRNRSRYRFMLSIPLNKKIIDKGTWFIALYDEIFISYGSNVSNNFYDQNRLYGALGYQLGKSSNLQVGYLNQNIQKSDGIHFENNHTLQVAFTQNLNFR